MNRINRALAILLASLALTGCAEKQEQAEPTPIVVEKPDITQTKEFKQAVSQRVDEVLGGEVSLTVYLDTAEDLTEVYNSATNEAKTMLKAKIQTLLQKM